MADLVANAFVTVNAAPEKVWKALVDPRAIKEYMFGTNVASEWKKGSKMTWKGEWQGRQYEDKGTILDLQPGRRLQYSHFSPLTGEPDKPENYHTVTIDLAADGNRTRVSLSQNNNATEEARAHSQKNWEMMLGALKKYLEGKAA
jgi:uncharacterized protein YndB with AHSA1/START domain